MKLVSRSAWGARAYRLPSGGIQYSGSRRGVKVHYLGGVYSDREHSRCDDYVRSVQNLHMDTNGWSDIGYSFVVCTHGYVYEGRGLKRRNSANGNTALNNGDYAVLGLVGTSGVTSPPSAMLHGLRDAIEHCRSNGPAGSWIGGHRDGYPTSCPGPALYAWVQKGAPRPGGDVPIVTTPKEDPVPETLGRTDDGKKTRAPGDWKALSIDGVDLVKGAQAYTVTVHLALTAAAGSTLQGRFYHYRPDGSRWKGSIIERTTTVGSSFVDFHHDGDIKSTESLRFELAYFPARSGDTAEAVITRSRVRGLYWKA